MQRLRQRTAIQHCSFELQPEPLRQRIGTRALIEQDLNIVGPRKTVEQYAVPLPEPVAWQDDHDVLDAFGRTHDPRAGSILRRGFACLHFEAIHN